LPEYAQGGKLNLGGERPSIVVSNAGKRFGELPVFREVDLQVGEREVLAIIGPSGCGKTTLLRCMNGLIPLSEGEIRIEGAPVAGPREGVAMVFQHFGLFPWKTVFQNIAYGLRLAGASRAEIEEKVPKFIKLVGLNGFEGYYPYQISGGMQQRCGLARALSIEPRVLLMRIWEQSRTTMVFVTHAIEEAVLMGDRVMVLKGRPSRVHEVVEVDLPRPRDRGTLLLPRFAELREHVWSTLMADARQAEFEVKR
jgi:NitT/TauT family transport system ATP-binding protein